MNKGFNSSFGFRRNGDWLPFTPVLSAATTDPTLGTNGYADGWYQVADGRCRFSGAVRFGTAGRDSGSGQYFLSLPVPADLTFSLDQAASEMTSTAMGWALLWRGGNSLDLVDAHFKANIYVPPSTDGTKVGIASNDWHKPGAMVGTSGGVSNGLAAAGSDLGNIGVTYMGAGRRWKLFAHAHVSPDTVAARSIYLEVRDAAAGAGNLMGIGGESFSDINVADLTDFGSVSVLTPTQVPTASTTYYARLWADSGGTIDVASWSLEAIQQPGLGALGAPASDYVGDATPWDWDDQSGQSEIWYGGEYTIA